ncbi:MAG: FAD/NAD(P)-binding protein [Thermoplasmatota archaeon]
MRYEVRIVGIRTETADTKTFEMSFIDPQLQAEFRFRPGQFILLSIPGLGEAAFSLSSSPLETSTFSTTVRKVGSFTGRLHEYCTEDRLWMAGPFGRGWPVEMLEGRNVLIIAGGLGILPLWPLICVLRSRRRDMRGVEILYGARSPADCVFLEHYSELRGINSSCLMLTVDRVPEGQKWENDIGLVTHLLDKMRSVPGKTVALICGPEVMMQNVIRGLLRKGFDARRLFVSLERRMRCGFGQCGHCQIGPKFVCKDGPVFRYSEVRNLPDISL